MTPESKILNVARHVYPDGAMEFGVRLNGPAQRFRIDYGDGFHEAIKLSGKIGEVTIYGEHKYKPGVYRAVVYLQLRNQVVDRRVMMVTQN